MADRYICTKEAPWTPEKGSGATHPDAVEGKQNDGHPGGDIVDYHCPNCGLDFEVELPQ